MKKIPWMRNQFFLFPIHLHLMKTVFDVSARKMQKLSLFWKMILFVALSLKSLDMSNLIVTHMMMIIYCFMG
jgi:hypothetical protein